jgi:DNA-binding beta-propeller fold protein YncE
MLTGLPTVLGWDHHVKQRGNPEADIIDRSQAVERIYSSKEAASIERLLRRYHVGYVYVGWLERKTYPVDGLRKFDRATDLFERVYENPEVRIYRVIGGDSEDVIVPARETVPATTGGEVVEEEETPAIAETPEAGRTPFSGMKEPRDGDFDDKERLWIADFGNSRIRIFDRDGGFLGGWGGRGNATYSLREPCSVSIRGDDVYVADTWNGRVQHFSLSGEAKGVAGELYGPRGVAAGPDGRVWVADTGNHRLAVYDAQLGNRQLIGKRGAGPLEFSSPVGIAISASGTVYVADAANHRIQVLAPDAGYLRSLPVNGWNGAVEPHVELGKDDTVYFTDPSANAVVALDSSGAEKGRWTVDGEGRKFANPTGLALDRKADILYVVNSGTSTISRLEIHPKKAP